MNEKLVFYCVIVGINNAKHTTLINKDMHCRAEADTPLIPKNDTKLNYFSLKS